MGSTSIMVYSYKLVYFSNTFSAEIFVNIYVEVSLILLLLFADSLTISFTDFIFFSSLIFSLFALVQNASMCSLDFTANVLWSPTV